MNLERLSCRKRVALLCEYLDQELPAASRKAIAAHRRSCLPCAEVLASLTRTVRALKGLRAGTKVPAAARQAWRSVLAGGARAQKRRTPWK
jgi:anti-sigma factor RsiW